MTRSAWARAVTIVLAGMAASAAIRGDEPAPEHQRLLDAAVRSLKQRDSRKAVETCRVLWSRHWDGLDDKTRQEVARVLLIGLVDSNHKAAAAARGAELHSRCPHAFVSMQELTNVDDDGSLSALRKALKLYPVLRGEDSGVIYLHNDSKEIIRLVVPKGRRKGHLFRANFAFRNKGVTARQAVLETDAFWAPAGGERVIQPGRGVIVREIPSARQSPADPYAAFLARHQPKPVSLLAEELAQRRPRYPLPEADPCVHRLRSLVARVPEVRWGRRTFHDVALIAYRWDPLSSLPEGPLVATTYLQPLRKQLEQEGLFVDDPQFQLLRKYEDACAEYARGTLHYSLGSLDTALNRFQSALAKLQQLHGKKDHAHVAATLNYMATCLHQLGRYREALRQVEAALAMRKRLYGRKDHAKIATSLGNLGGILLSLGRGAEALSAEQSALSMEQRLHSGKDHPDVASRLSNLAGCLTRLGRNAEALPYVRAALAMRTRLHGKKDHEDVAHSQMQLAGCLYALDRPAETLAHARAALQMRQRLTIGKPYSARGRPEIAEGHRNVGCCLARLGRLEDALPELRKALEMEQRIHAGLDHPAVVSGHGNLATCLHMLGRRDDALQHLQAGAQMAERLKSPSLYDIASDLGTLYLDGYRDARKAVEWYEKAITAIEQARALMGGTDLDRIRYLGTIRGACSAFEGMVEARLRLGQTAEALAYLERGRATVLRDVLERGQRRRGGDLLSAVEGSARQGNDRELLGSVHRARRELREAAAQVATLTTQSRIVASRKDLGDPKRRAKLAAMQQQLARARDRQIAARRAVFNLAGRHVLGDIQALPAGEIRKLLAPGQVLLTYGVRQLFCMLLVVPAQGPIQAFALQWPDGKAVKEKDLAAAVRRYVGGMIVEGMRSRGLRPEAMSAAELQVRGVRRECATADASTVPKTGRRLFLALLPRAVRRIVKDAKLVYVVPDGQLHRLPFESLPVAVPDDAAAGKRTYWLDGWPPIVYGPSATVLINRRKVRDAQLVRWAKGQRPKQLATLLGDPVFSRSSDSTSATTRPVGTQPAAAADGRGPDGTFRGGYLSRYGTLGPLPGTRKEVRRIYQTLTGEEYQKGQADKGVAVLLGRDATRTRLFAEAPGSRYVHLATHGLTDTSRTADYSSLALTQPPVPTPEDFGFLTLMDLFDNWWGRLRDTELVVLSACDTQRGRIESGEGVFGISWGFLYAGSPAVIASLWQVADESTAEMMGGLYGRIRKISREQAQRQRSAKLKAFVEVRKALREKHPQPYFWAPFIYIGDPR